MDDSILTADPTLLVVDTEAGQTAGTTFVTYDGGSYIEIYLWWRITPATIWKQLNLYKAVGTASAGHKGQFPSPPIPPGACYEVRMYPEKTDDPNAPSGASSRPLKTLSVCALRKRSRREITVTDQAESAGGTFHTHTVATLEQTQFAIAVSTQPPVMDSNLMFHLVAVTTSFEESFGQIHPSELDGLLPGTTYFCLVRLIDEDGNWLFLVSKFTTLLRKVTIHFTDLIIDNDGDPGGTGTASFVFRVKEGTNTVAEFTLGDDEFDINDRSGWNDIALTYTHILGPKPIPPEIYRVAVALSGQEYDGWLEDDEFASNWEPGEPGQPLEFPTGLGKETVLNRVRSFKADPENDDFSFTVKVVYSVEYS